MVTTMNNKITFTTTTNYNEAVANNGFNQESDYIITDGVYDFSDYLKDNDVDFIQDGNTYFVIEDEEKTGAAYQILKEEPTDEELRG